MTDSHRRFARLAWSVLGWNLFVVLWGAFVRASGSGAGCGEHWPLCNGAILPPSPTLTTIIEFMHRITSGVALLSVGALLFFALRIFPKGHPTRRFSGLSLVLILIEALLGAGLVLLAYVEKNASAGRAVYLCLHLTNTLLLLTAIAAAAWSATRPISTWAAQPGLIKAAFAAALLSCLSGVIAALGDTIWPAATLAEGLKADFTSASPALLRLRLLHPVLASSAGIFLLTAAVTKIQAPYRNVIVLLTTLQLTLGVTNVILLAPTWMQIVHLAVACILWLTLALAAFSRPIDAPAAP